MNKFNIPLRIILTQTCNGKCGFCHHEGSSTELIMTIKQIEEILLSANQLNIQKITFSGGEPFLYPYFDELLDLLRFQKNNNPQFHLGLTTNGILLNEYLPILAQSFDYISCSINSLDNWQDYTNVNPLFLSKSLFTLNIKKAINAVINDRNYYELEKLINYAHSLQIALSLMVEVPLSKQSFTTQINLINFFLNKGFSIKIIKNGLLYYGHVQGSNSIIKLKLPIFSMLQNFNFCKKCPFYQTCGEYVCGIRFFSNNIISPCLNSHYSLEITDNLTNELSCIIQKILEKSE